MSRGAFITVEGIDGCGKTTQTDFIEGYLSRQGIKVVHSREPGGTKFGDALRKILLDSKYPITNAAELYVLYAARAQHVAEVILPALERGDWVLCDRFADSTYAYQGGGRKIDNEIIEDVGKAISKAKPDLTLLLDVSPEVGRARVSKRAPSDRFEKESLEFSEGVRAIYLLLAEQFKKRIKVIDAERSLEEVQAQIKTEIKNFQQNWND